MSRISNVTQGADRYNIESFGFFGLAMENVDNYIYFNIILI